MLGRHVVKGANDAALRGQADGVLARSRRVGCIVAFAQLRETEVEQFDELSGDHHVRGLQVTMDDAAAVSGVERSRDLDRPSQRRRRRNWTASQALRQRLAFDVLHHEVGDAVLRSNVVHRTDVRMTQSGYRLRLTLEPRPPGRVVGDAGWKNLDGDVAVQPGVARAIDLAHAASSKGHSRFQMNCRRSL